MNKKELINVVTETAGLTKKDVTVVVDAVFDTITSTLSKGQEVKISGFGTFKVKERAERKVRNPQSGEEIVVEARKVPTFKAGKQLKELVK